MGKRIINPGVTVDKVQITKNTEGSNDYGDFECTLSFSDGTSHTYELDHWPDELDDVNYGIYDWTGEKFVQIEDWGDLDD